MSEKNDQHRESNKSDWNTLDARLALKKTASDTSSAKSSMPVPSSTANLPQAIPDPGNPIDVNCAFPVADLSGIQGLIAKVKLKKERTNAAVREVHMQVEAKLDLMAHALKNSLAGGKKQLDQRLKVFLMQLNDAQTQALDQIGISISERRRQMLVEATDRFVAALKDVEERDWPRTIIDRTVDNLLVMHKRVETQLMEDYGVNLADDSTAGND